MYETRYLKYLTAYDVNTENTSKMGKIFSVCLALCDDGVTVGIPKKTADVEGLQFQHGMSKSKQSQVQKILYFPSQGEPNH